MASEEEINQEFRDLMKEMRTGEKVERWDVKGNPDYEKYKKEQLRKELLDRLSKKARQTSNVSSSLLRKIAVEKFKQQAYAKSLEEKKKRERSIRLRLELLRLQRLRKIKFVPSPVLPIGWESYNVTPQIEREVLGVGKEPESRGFSSEGDYTALRLGVESAQHSHKQHGNVINNVSEEVKRLSRLLG